MWKFHTPGGARWRYMCIGSSILHVELGGAACGSFILQVELGGAACGSFILQVELGGATCVLEVSYSRWS